MSRDVVTNYGADPTGVADSTSAIQTALNDCSSLGTYPGQQLFFRAGTYKITASVTLGGSNYNLVGEGPGASIISYSGAVNTLSLGHLNVTGASLVGLQMTGLRLTSATPGGSVYGLVNTGGVTTNTKLTNCKFDGFFASGVRASNIMDQMVIDGCEFTNNGTAAMGANPTTASINGSFTNSVVRNCSIHDTGQANTLNHGIYMNGGCQNVLITNNYFNNCLGDACAFGTSTDGFGGNPQNYGVTFANNIVTNCGGFACEFTSCSGATAVGNTVIGNPNGSGFEVGPVCYGWNISNNNISFSGSLASAITNTVGGICSVLYGASNGVISNNTAAFTRNFNAFYTCPGVGINLGGAVDVEIYGNSISGYNVGIGVYANPGPNNNGQNKRVNIHDNNLAIFDNAVDNTGGKTPFGTSAFGSSTTVGIAINGYSSDIYTYNNRFRNFNYGVYICNQVNLFQAPPLTTANITANHNRFYACNYALGFAPTASVTNVAFDNNLGCIDVQNLGGTVRNFRALNNGLDGSYWSQPGAIGNQTVL